MGNTGQRWCGYPYPAREADGHNSPMPSPAARLPLAGVAFLALADTAIVALALPPILRELDTDVAGVAAVLGVYAVVLAIALLPAERVGRMRGMRELGLAGVALFGLGSLVCGLAGSIELLLGARALQALGGAALLVTAHSVLVGEPAARGEAAHTATASGEAADTATASGEAAYAATARLEPGGRRQPGLRLWRLAALLGTAAGPALGGALTQVFGWRSIFLVQAPAALAAVPGCLTAAGRRVEPAALSRERGSSPALTVAFAALALVSGAIAAALFLTVLLLISGWGIEPLAGALVVSIMPLSALAAIRIGGPPRDRAAMGALLVAAGAAALAFLPTASVAWTILPQIAVGVGMGLALAALAGELLPDRDGHESARLLTMRHAGIALALLLLAPIAQHELDTTLQDTRLRGAALILDARIDPQLKLAIAPRLSGSVETEDPRGGLEDVFADARGDVKRDQLTAYDELTTRADDLLVTGVDDGFRTAFLVAAGLALLAAALLALAAARAPAIATVAVAAALAVTAFALIANSVRPESVELANPCEDRELPSTGGVTGFAQDAALVAADVIACRVGSSREELVLALANEGAARDYEKRYGVNPRSALDIAKRFLPG
jgi:MFS family permease